MLVFLRSGLRSEKWVTPVVIATVIALSALTVALRSVHAHVRDGMFDEHLSRGHALVAETRLTEAVEEFRAALALKRDNAAAGRALALTLLELGQTAESETHLRGLLRLDPTNGPLNRGLAQIYAARGRAADARAAYQRAIYGEWPDDAVAGRIAARFEFIEHLTRIGADKEVLPELLRLRAELPPGQTASARRIADLLVDHGAPDLALDTLRTSSVLAPRDVELLAQLADLQSSTGQLGAARATLRKALAIEPHRADVAKRLHIVERVLSLDPTLPRLSLVSRTHRARLVLGDVLEQTAPCAPGGDAQFEQLRREGLRRMRRPARADARVAEENLTLAARLWDAAPACHAQTAEGLATGQILQRVAATGGESGA